ncbi:TA system VapC family ribonuclease toxin [Microbacterium sp. 2FI]|uniref:TA system VapC family ribonuclease toxin n=1 Tax=Microbacterium sp. 2FI TaxID=2502193 RepID=UPI002017D6DC|nr:TA system VapC family ribonuclease toxin [Microbacterium sp. 2FI]
MPDVNVLVGAFRRDAPGHEALKLWLEQAVDADEALGLAPAVITGTVRVLTNRRVFSAPDDVETALHHVDHLLAQPEVAVIGPGPRHWEIFSRLCREGDARGNLASDAAHAAIAIEHGATWVSLDRDFARFPGLRWETPNVS